MFATPDLKPFIFQPCNNFETSKYALKTRQLYFPTSGKEVVARFERACGPKTQERWDNPVLREMVFIACASL